MDQLESLKAYNQGVSWVILPTLKSLCPTPPLMGRVNLIGTLSRYGVTSKRHQLALLNEPGGTVFQSKTRHLGTTIPIGVGAKQLASSWEYPRQPSLVVMEP